MTIQLVTANALQDGAVVFLTSSGGWSAAVADAATAADKTAADALMTQAEMAVIDNIVIGPYLNRRRVTEQRPGPAALPGADPRRRTDERDAVPTAPLLTRRRSRNRRPRNVSIRGSASRNSATKCGAPTQRRADGGSVPPAAADERPLSATARLHATGRHSHGTLSSRQLRRLAHIARVYDRGYGYITTRQNIQYNWPRLVDTPDVLSELADVEMHAIQTSGNCNVTADHYAGAIAGEVTDPRICAEIVRQWSSLHRSSRSCRASSRSRSPDRRKIGR